MIALTQGLMAVTGAQVQFIASTGANYVASGTSINTPSTPEGVQSGDGLFAIIFTRSAITAPSGWTLVASQTNTDIATQTLHLYRRDSAAPTDSSTAFSWSQAESGRMGLCYVLARSNTGALSVAQSATVETDRPSAAATQTANIPSLTAAANGELCLFCATSTLSSATAGENTWAPAAGTVRTSNSQSDGRLIACTQELNAGNSSAATMTLSTASAADNYFSAISARLVSA